MTVATIQLHPETPKWAIGFHQQHFWYHVTGIGEQLVARLEDGILHFYGYDIGEMSLDVEQVENTTEWVRHQLLRKLLPADELNGIRLMAHTEAAATSETQPRCPISDVNFSTGELLWIASVLDAAKLSMRKI